MIDKLTLPFAYLLRWIYSFTNDYVLTLLLFAILTTIIVLPLTIISRKNQSIKIKMKPEIVAIQKKYEKPKDAPIASPDKPLEEREAILAADKERKNKQKNEIAQIYEKYKFNPLIGPISTIIKLFFVIAIFRVVTAPLTHLCLLPAEVVTEIVNYATSLVSAEKTISQLQAFEIMRQNFNEFILQVPSISQHFHTVSDLPNLTIFNGLINAAKMPSLRNPDILLIFPVLIYLLGILEKLIPDLIKHMRIRKKGTAQNTKIEKILYIFSVLISPAFLTYIAFQVPPLLCVYYLFSGGIRIILNLIFDFTIPLPDEMITISDAMLKNPQPSEITENDKSNNTLTIK